MPKLPNAVRFILFFLLIYFGLVLMTQASGVSEGFTQSFSSWASGFYKNYLPETEITIQSVADKGEHDAIISLLNAKTKPALLAAAREQGLEMANLQANFFNFSLWDFFLLQFIVLLALVLAAPINWKQKGGSFLLGSLVLGLFTFHRFHCSLKYYGIEAPLMEPMGFSSFTEVYVKGVFAMQSIEFIFISTFLIWALTTISKSNYRAFIG